MAMNKKEQAALAEARREVKLHQLCVLLPPLEPDLPPPSHSGPDAVMGWSFNAHRNSERVYPAISEMCRHKLGTHDEGKHGHGWRQNGIWLYSTKELATEAMKRAVIRGTSSHLLETLERIENE